ncbi:MAG TPA: hypothetical protein VEY71_00090, partial [Chitinophagales bacterium]|nr:hypothetical protein [Chitinophagales bacterium]
MTRFLIFLSLLMRFSAFSQSTFSVTYLKPDTLYGLPGDALTHAGLVENLTTQIVNVRITRVEQDLPANWNTAMVFGTSLPPSTSTYAYGIGAGNTDPFEIWFLSDPIASGLASALIRFSDENDSTVVYEKAIYASTLQPLGTSGDLRSSPHLIYPNPTSGKLRVSYVPSFIYDSTGRLIFTAEATDVNVSGFPNG